MQVRDPARRPRDNRPPLGKPAAGALPRSRFQIGTVLKQLYLMRHPSCAYFICADGGKQAKVDATPQGGCQVQRRVCTVCPPMAPLWPYPRDLGWRPTWIWW